MYTYKKKLLFVLILLICFILQESQLKTQKTTGKIIFPHLHILHVFLEKNKAKVIVSGSAAEA